MDWFEKLNEYFPIHEMKSKKHMEMLLKERGDVYYKDESDDHVMMYAEFDEFIFIDYLYVAGHTRGKGVGHKLLQKLKQKNKPIILEVEPVDYEDTDTKKRLHFYKREAFQHASSIGYSRRSLETNEKSPLEILYWSPTNETEEEVEKAVFKQVHHLYENIHTYKDKEVYGQSYEKIDDVLSIRDKDEKINIFDSLE